MIQEELLKLINTGMTFLVMCRSAAEPLAQGFIRHYHCKVCGKELQVSPRGRQQIIAGGISICNTCGISLVEARAREARAGRAGPTDIMLGPFAESQIQRAADAGDPDARDLLL
jgi:hypothetical protein